MSIVLLSLWLVLQSNRDLNLIIDTKLKNLLLSTVVTNIYITEQEISITSKRGLYITEQEISITSKRGQKSIVIRSSMLKKNSN
jgi:hypothetical protein